MLSAPPSRRLSSLLLIGASLALAPLGAAQHLLVGSRDTLVRRTLPVTEAFDLIGACGGIVQSMAATGETTYIGDQTGQIYVHTPAAGLNYAFNTPGDAVALALFGDQLFSGASNGAIARHDGPSGTLEVTWRAPGPVRALVVSAFDLYVLVDAGGVYRTSVVGNGDFQWIATVGGTVSAMTADATGLLIGTSAGLVHRLDFGTQTVSPGFAVASDCTALGVSLLQLLVGGSDGTVRRVDAHDGTVHDIYQSGSSVDALVLTEGQHPGWTYCYGFGCPCGNGDPIGGCSNSTGRGARLDAAGSSSVAVDDLALIMTSAPAFAPAILIMGSDLSFSTVGDGLLCTGGSGTTRRFAPTASNAFGTLVIDGLGAYTAGQFDPAAQFVAGSSWHFQIWYRDVNGPCGSGFNTTNSAEIFFSL